MKLLIALIIKLLLDIPLMLLGLILVPIAILTNWPKIFWLWGNDDHPDNGGIFWAKQCGTSFLCAYKWFALRNPTFNFSKYLLGTKLKDYQHKGDTGIGDKKKGGSYWCYMGKYFEYYYIKPYTLFKVKRCIRIRFGWKIYGKKVNEICQFCFVVNPFMPYSGK